MERKVTAYRLLSTKEDMGYLLLKGWEPFGSPVIDNNNTFYQAWVQYKS